MRSRIFSFSFIVLFCLNCVFAATSERFTPPTKQEDGLSGVADRTSRKKPLNPFETPSDEEEEFRTRVGNAMWTVLHMVAAKYPDDPSPCKQLLTKTWIELLPEIYPCEECALHIREHFEKFPILTTNRTAFEDSLFEFHNRVNKQLNKSTYDDIESLRSEWRTIASCNGTCPLKPHD